ncbi:MAG: hypothetical protein ACRDFY_03215 [Candidatus Limnocylindria bacterium]
MHSLQDLHVLRQLTGEREAQLHHAIPAARRSSRRSARRRLGFQLVRLGAWVAAEPAMRPAPAR